VLRIESVNAGYGQLQILFEVTVEAKPRSITVLLGPNGSGKSTLLKTVFGLTKVYSGRILFEDRDITRVPPHERARLGIAYVPQTGNVFESLSVEENLKLAGHGLGKREFMEKLREVFDIFPFLRDVLKRRAAQLSGGQRQMLGVAMALIRSAKLIMLDEPTAALAPKVAVEVMEKLVELVRRGITILMAEQNALLALKYADWAYLLVSGQVRFAGSAEELLARKDLAELYLGLKHA